MAMLTLKFGVSFYFCVVGHSTFVCLAYFYEYGPKLEISQFSPVISAPSQDALSIFIASFLNYPRCHDLFNAS